MSTNTNLGNYLIQSKLCGLYGGEDKNADTVYDGSWIEDALPSRR